ncbi:hypothetical protein DGG96_14550 [Legionella qingyii]|uniref:Uncharacterized protein n=1 Tax=Legionella qingyii TaxID=2184757 RepID=A0A317TZD0_9GAMM|nr:hypothetical protein DGG96_14550 [Legionella qingyii]
MREVKVNEISHGNGFATVDIGKASIQGEAPIFGSREDSPLAKLIHKGPTVTVRTSGFTNGDPVIKVPISKNHTRDFGPVVYCFMITNCLLIRN